MSPVYCVGDICDEARLNAVVRKLLSKGGGGYPSDQQVKEARTQIIFCKNMTLSDAEAADSSIQRSESRRSKYMRTDNVQGTPVKKGTLADCNRQYNNLLKIARDIAGMLELWQYGKIQALQTHCSKFPQLTSFAAIQRLVKYMGCGDYLRETVRPGLHREPNGQHRCYCV